MTAEVNAAIEGALAGAAEEVIVNDSHDGMRNLIPEELHPACRFIAGNDKPLGMVQGVDLDGIGALFYTGYHAKAGTPNAPLAHTWSGWLNDVRFDGRSVGEWGINAATAGHWGVPVALVTGDDKAVAQTREFCGDGVVGVVVKEGLSTFAALNLHPAKAQELIRAGAEQATRRAKELKPYTLPRGCRVELEFEHQARADQACYVPRVERTGERGGGGGAENGCVRGVLMASGYSPDEAVQIDDLAAWEAWLESHGGEGGQVWLAIYKKASK
jgi:D-amino peptidase